MARTYDDIKQRRRERYQLDKQNPDFVEKLRLKRLEKYKNNPAAEIERRTQYFIDNPEKYLLTTIRVDVNEIRFRLI